MGSEDYMFLESIKHVTREHKNSKLIVVPQIEKQLSNQDYDR